MRKSTDPIQHYFNAERAESSLFIAMGLLSAGLALFFWFAMKKPLASGAAWPLLLIALIQVTVGTSVYLRSPKDIERVQRFAQSDRPLIGSEEIPRMHQVMRNFVLYRWIEISLIVVGILLVWAAGPESFWRGVGIGLAVQAALMLMLDYFAEKRGGEYLAFLDGL